MIRRVKHFLGISQPPHTGEWAVTAPGRLVTADGPSEPPSPAATENAAPAETSVSLADPPAGATQQPVVKEPADAPAPETPSAGPEVGAGANDSLAASAPDTEQAASASPPAAAAAAVALLAEPEQRAAPCQETSSLPPLPDPASGSGQPAAPVPADAWGTPGLSAASAFAALLAAEQGEPLPPGAPPPTPATFEPDEALIDRIAERVAHRIADRLVQGAVADSLRQTVSDVAERLVREEIARIRAAAAARTHS